jgi:DNA (cytosine-5)-methyltransferase 3A
MRSKINVLSLFDGMSCGHIALDRVGMEIDSYFASEIDKNAIKVTTDNYPYTIHLGDVTMVDGKKLPKIHLLMGGSPCQGFSFAGKQLNFEDPRSKLFFEFVRLLKETKPTYFLLENVKMKKEYEDIITEYLGVEPIFINSSLVSAQNRRRLYWTNIPNITQPEDRKITLNDVIDTTIVSTLTTNWEIYSKGVLTTYLDPYNRRPIKGDKSTTLRTNIYNGNMWVLNGDGEGYRNLTVSEYERLQTVPLGYTKSVTETQAKKMLGNGWTIDVISHIFSFIGNY